MGAYWICARRQHFKLISHNCELLAAFELCLWFNRFDRWSQYDIKDRQLAEVKHGMSHDKETTVNKGRRKCFLTFKPKDGPPVYKLSLTYD